jgi:protein TonB
MRNENAEEQSMDDLVFENRNKEYGAYVLRKVYYDNVHKALLYVMVFFAGVMMLTLFFPGDPLVKVPEIPRGIIEFNILPTIEAPKPAAPSAQVRRAVTRATPTVTTAVVTDKVIPSVTDAISGTADGAVDGVAPIEGSGPATAEPVVATPAVVEPPKTFVHPEVMPQYEGGMEALARYMRKNLKYPAVARRMGTEGSVYVSFIIDTEGHISEAKVIKGISKECDEEAVRVVSRMPSWIAGRQGNAPVIVRMVLPIKFQLGY